MEKFILACDFDHTLFVDGSVSPENISAIKRLRDKGGLFGIVSGRTSSSYSMLYDSVEGNIDFILCCTGAVFYKSAEAVEFASYSDKTAFSIFEYAKSREVRFFCADFLGKTLAVSPRDENASSQMKEFLTECGRVNHCSVCFFSVEAADKGAREISDMYGEMVNPQQNGCMIDIPPYGIDKARGLYLAAEKLGVLPDRIFAAGDNYNDISMITSFHGIAMSGGVEELKERADIVTPDVASAIDIIMKRV